MHTYFTRNGFAGEFTEDNVIDWLGEKGFTFNTIDRDGEQPCNEIFIENDKVGEVWCDYSFQIWNTTLEYIRDNDLMRLCDAV